MRYLNNLLDERMIFSRQFKSIVIICLLTTIFFALKVQSQIFKRPDFFERGDQLIEKEIRNLQRKKSDPDLTFDISNSPVPRTWQAFLFREAKFSIWMPQGIFSEGNTTLELATKVIEFEQFSSNLPLEKFIVAYSDNLDLEQISNQKNILKQVQEGIVKRTKFQLKSEKFIDLGEYLGKELILEDRVETIVFKIYSIQQRIYVLGISQPRESEDKEKQVIFFNSFNLLE